MRLEMDLVREILTKIEELSGPDPKTNTRFNVDGYTNDQLIYHIAKLMEAGYVLGVKAESSQHRILDAVGIDLSWEGHQFLKSIRNDSVWKKMKARLGDQLTSAPMAVVGELGRALLSKELLSQVLG